MLQYDGRCCEGKLGKMGCTALCSLENGVHIWMESKQTHSQTNRQRKYTRNCWVMPSWCRCCRCCLPVKYLFDFWLMNNRWAAISFCCVCVFLCWFYVCQWQVNFGEYPIHLSTNWKNWMKMPMQRVTHQTYIHSHHTTHVHSAFESALRDWSSVPVCIYICEYVNTSRWRIPPQPSIDLALN